MIIELCQVLSKLCRQPIIVFIPEHEVCFPLNQICKIDVLLPNYPGNEFCNRIFLVDVVSFSCIGLAQYVVLDFFFCHCHFIVDATSP